MRNLNFSVVYSMPFALLWKIAQTLLKEQSHEIFHLKFSS
jgi:hypothetical protein